ncbi:MAG TPA: hypothetical protein VE996_04385 [Terriglobales bacterium]|nr:hypothetical protein [Terriglobales bacterium]
MTLLAAFACVFFTALAAWFVFAGDERLPEDSPAAARLRALRERKQAIYDNLRDLHFEFLAGKLAQPDYQRSRQMLETEAARVVREIQRCGEAS